jgi:hypothetical protein
MGKKVQREEAKGKGPGLEPAREPAAPANALTLRELSRRASLIAQVAERASAILSYASIGAAPPPSDFLIAWAEEPGAALATVVSAGSWNSRLWDVSRGRDEASAARLLLCDAVKEAAAGQDTGAREGFAQYFPEQAAVNHLGDVLLKVGRRAVAADLKALRAEAAVAGASD